MDSCNRYILKLLVELVCRYICMYFWLVRLEFIYKGILLFLFFDINLNNNYNVYYGIWCIVVVMCKIVFLLLKIILKDVYNFFFIEMK